MTEWLRALRGLFTPTAPGHKSPSLYRRGNWQEWYELANRTKPSPQDGLTFDEVVEWLDLPKPMRRAKRVRAVLLEATTLGMVRVENGRFFANELLFYGGPDKSKLIDPRPLVRRRADECGSCGGHLSERMGLYLCQGCGRRIDKQKVRFVCQRCGKYRDGYQDGSGEAVSTRFCDVRRGDYTQNCIGVATTEPPKRTAQTTAQYWATEDVLACPYCSSWTSWKSGTITPDENGLVWCSTSYCGMPFYLPDNWPSASG